MSKQTFASGNEKEIYECLGHGKPATRVDSFMCHASMGLHSFSNGSLLPRWREGDDLTRKNPLKGLLHLHDLLQPIHFCQPDACLPCLRFRGSRHCYQTVTPERLNSLPPELSQRYLQPWVPEYISHLNVASLLAMATINGDREYGMTFGRIGPVN